ncbi:MAG: DUF1573 domain-containing protein [Chitinophagaceae bacterium]|nr:DUF1573 domain-containing protein [Chitinophagaceae bacterium]
MQLYSHKLSLCLPFFIFFIGCKSNKNLRTYAITPSVTNFSISRDTTLETVFHIKNYGSQNLIISEISTSCGCVVGALRDSVVPTNDSVELKIKYTPKTTDSGKIVRYISIRTNGYPPIKSAEIVGFVH